MSRNRALRRNGPGMTGIKLAAPRDYAFARPQCAHCGSSRMRPLASIYGRGTTIYTRIKGLVLRHGYERTVRQSILARACRPPRELSHVPVAACLLLGIGADWAGRAWRTATGVMGQTAYDLYWGALILGTLSVVYNRTIFRSKLRRWNSSYYCDSCANVTVLDH